MSQSGLKEPVLLYDANGDPLVLGQATMALSVPVAIASNQTALPVSAASLPLPAGAATEATLVLVKAKTDNLDVLLSSRAVTGLTDAQLRASAVPVSGIFFQVTQPVSAASLPLPAGAATEATLALIKAKTDNLDVALSTRAGDRTTAAAPFAVRLSDGAVFITTLPVSVASLPLPAGAATEATLATRATEATLALIKAKTDNLDVALSTRAVTGLTDAQLRATAVPVSGPLTDAQLRAAAVPVSAASLPLPAGAATEATLALIKNTDGIKKIVDPLPAGTNTLGKVDQGVAAAVAGGWPVKVTDGTNLLPTMDVAARAAFFKQTDGTNVAPTGDVVARSIFQQISDGTTGPVTVKPASTAASSADKPLVVTMHPSSAALSVSFTAANARTGVSSGSLVLGGSTANTQVVLRATAYVEPTAAAQRSIKSASANDTSAGTGARTVEITYFDNTGTGPLTETVTLNGTTAVNTVATNIRFIESMVVKTAGSLLTNAGVLSLYTTTAGGGTVIGSIGTGSLIAATGDGQTLWAHHYCPADRTVEFAVLTAGIQSGGSGTSGQFFVKSIAPLVANAVEKIEGGVLLTTGEFQRSYDFHPKIVGFARLTAYAIPSVNNATVSAAFDWSEVLT